MFSRKKTGGFTAGFLVIYPRIADKVHSDPDTDKPVPAEPVAFYIDSTMFLLFQEWAPAVERFR